MTRMKTIAAAVAAMSMAAVVAPAYSGEVEDLKASMKKMMQRIEQLEAQQKKQAVAAKAAPAAVPANVVVAGDLPNSIKIPGTNTSIRVYGYAQMDGTYDFKGRNSDPDGMDWASFVAAQPLDNSTVGRRKNQFYTTMKTSRLGLETSTPIDGSNLKVKLEGDFNAPNAFQGEGQTNSVLFRLRHAYGEYNNLLIGQTWSNFLDLGSFADTVDFNGPGAVPMIRQPQVRYTVPLSSGTLALSLENPQSIALGASTPNSDRRPDVTANFTTNFKDGHFSARAATLNYHTDAQSKQGYALGIGGSYKFSGNDTVVAQINGGKGIGRYMLNSFLQGANEIGGQIQLWKAVGGHIGYTHAWDEKTRSNLIYAYTKFSGNSALEGLASAGAYEPNRTINEFAINTFWKPYKNTELGLEYAWGQRETFAGDKGTQSRVNATARFSLF